MSWYLTDKEFEEWLKTGGMTISEFKEILNGNVPAVYQGGIVRGAYSYLLRPGLSTVFNESIRKINLEDV